MPDPTSNRAKATESTAEGVGCSDAGRWAGEPLEGSGFENEAPDPEFEWRD